MRRDAGFGTWSPLLAAFLFVALPAIPKASAAQQAAVGELFTYKIEPQLFNWTHQVMNEQFRYRAALRGYPDLPSWLRYQYSKEYHHAGFLYGTPPDRMAGRTLTLDLVALNRQNYETRQTVLDIFVAHKFPSPNVVQMKIDNLNWFHMMDAGRVENLLNLFRKDLWPESDADLSMVFMESAVNMGGRLPLRPQQREGVIVSLGSFAQFSPRLRDLQEEVRPLYKLPTCTYKRTSVQKIFENVGFKLDWCAFKIMGADISPEILFHNKAGYPESEGGHVKKAERWQGIARDETPTRNYIDEFAFAFAIPGMIFAVLLGILSAVLCFQHPKFHDPQSELFFDRIFKVCEESCGKPHEISSTSEDDDDDDESIPDIQYPSTSSAVQMVQCADSNKTQPFMTTTLKSLKDPNCLLDNTSMRSQSPNNSFYPTDSPSNSYVRPKPPPYKGTITTGSLTLGKSPIMPKEI